MNMTSFITQAYHLSPLLIYFFYQNAYYWLPKSVPKTQMLLIKDEQMSYFSLHLLYGSQPLFYLLCISGHFKSIFFLARSAFFPALWLFLHENRHHKHITYVWHHSCDLTDTGVVSQELWMAGLSKHLWKGKMTNGWNGLPLKEHFED